MSPVHALVLSGGGAYAAYEVGVMRALWEGKCPATDGAPLQPGIFTGTSAGAFNAGLMVSQPEPGSAAALDRLQSAWMDEIASGPGRPHNGVYRMRLNPMEFFNPMRYLSHRDELARHLTGDVGFLLRESFRRFQDFWRSRDTLMRRAGELLDITSFLDTEPFHDLVKRSVNAERIAASPVQLRVPVTNWRDGTVQIYENATMGANAAKIVLASGSLPGIFRPVTIGDRIYVDGGVVMNTPLMPAIRAKADVVHAIYLDPEVKALQLDLTPSALSSFNRLILATTANMVNADIEMARLINRGLLRIEAEGKTGGEREHALAELCALLTKTPTSTKKDLRLLTVHRYRPEKSLGSLAGILNFDSWHIESLIARGYQDALRHDCERAGCVLPHGAAASAAAVAS